jgi:preprotein translocase subunit SecE
MQMEETKNVQTASQPAKGKKDKKEKKNNKFFAEHKAEFKKISWPNREDLTKETITVIVVSLLVGAIIFGMDELLTWGYDALISLI